MDLADDCPLSFAHLGRFQIWVRLNQTPFIMRFPWNEIKQAIACPPFWHEPTFVGYTESHIYIYTIVIIISIIIIIIFIYSQYIYIYIYLYIQ